MSDVFDGEIDEPQLPPVYLMVEDGTGVSGANSVVTVAEADSYNFERGRQAWLAYDEFEKARRLVLATDFVMRSYRWKGRRKFRTQPLAFPRIRLIDADGFPVDGIPFAVKAAVCEAAWLDEEGTGLFLKRSTEGDIKSEQVDVLKTEYFERTEKDEWATGFKALDTLLWGLYLTGEEKEEDETPERAYTSSVIWSGR